MFFTRTHKYHLSIPTHEFKSRLIGKHVRIHNLDFEVAEDGDTLLIVPHTEQVNAIKTLPLTTVAFAEDSGKTKVTITSEMRKVDAGGPQLIMVFCLFLFIAAIVLFFTSSEIKITWTFAAMSVLIFGIFRLRMQTGYFDYVHKIRDYVKERGTGVPAAAEMGAPALA